MVLLFVAVPGLALLFANICCAEPTMNQPLALTIGEVNDCFEFPKLPQRMTRSTFRVDPKDNDMYINSTLVLEQPLDDPITLRFEFFKCVAKEEDSCSLQGAKEKENACDEIGKKGKVWSPFIESIEGFEPKCPVPAGKYNLVDGPVTRAIRESGVEMIQGHWRIKSKLIKNGTTIACVWGYGEIKPKRRERSKKMRGK